MTDTLVLTKADFKDGYYINHDLIFDGDVEIEIGCGWCSFRQIKVGGDLTGREGVSIQSNGWMRVEGRIETGKSIVATKGVVAGDSIDCGGNVIAGEGIECSGWMIVGGFIRSQEYVIAKMMLSADGGVFAGDEITCDCDIFAGGDLEAGGEIKAVGEIRSHGRIASGDGIFSGGHISASGEIAAAYNITAGSFVHCTGDLTVGGRIFAGVRHDVDPAAGLPPGEKAVICARLISGVVAHGDLVELHKKQEQE